MYHRKEVDILSHIRCPEYVACVPAVMQLRNPLGNQSLICRCLSVRQAASDLIMDIHIVNTNCKITPVIIGMNVMPLAKSPKYKHGESATFWTETDLWKVCDICYGNIFRKWKTTWRLCKVLWYDDNSRRKTASWHLEQWHYKQICSVQTVIKHTKLKSFVKLKGKCI